MVRQMRLFMVAAFLMLCCVSTVLAQSVKGRLIDAATEEPLIGASVVVQGTTNGTVTDFDGYFTLQVTARKSTLKLSYIGYKDKVVKVNRQGNSVNLGTVKMKADVVTMQDVVVTSSVAVSRKTPVALSTIDPVFIADKLGTKEFPEILKSTPGVYATKSGGGFGDAKINMRGFKSENVAVMVNGVPMNDMERGSLYWSNWAGLSDVTRSMQTQRGLGASKVSAPSVGGSINIVTKSIDARKGGSLSYGMGNDGYNSLLFSVSTGLNEDGWAVTLLGGKKWGNGYIQGTEFEGYNYFLNISKRLNEAHQLSFTVFGAPQTHYQRSSYDGLSIEGWQDVKKYMGDDSPYKYNATYGFDKNGKRRSSTYNNYHKPQLSLNHQWQISSNSSLSTSLYMSIGRGYGNKGVGTNEYRSTWYGSSNGVLNTKWRKEDGTFAYDEIQDLNEQSQNGSLMVMTKSKNFHDWYGLVSTFTASVDEYIDFYGGVDLRYYKGTHTNEITDLYNGDYYVDSYYRKKVVKAGSKPSALTDPNYANQKLGIGDVVYRDYDGFVMQEGAFGQLELNYDELSAFVSGSLSNTSYWRRDRYYYDNEKSKTVSFIGYTIKGGANYNIDENLNVFFNAGYISRAPFFSGGAFLQSTTSNMTNPDAVNEKVLSGEVGCGYKDDWLKVNVNAYYTLWKDKTMAKTSDYSYPVKVPGEKDKEISDRWVCNMSGVDARHMGVELDFVARPFRWLKVNGMFSYGDWKWANDATGYFYNEAGQALKNLKGETTTDIQSTDHLSSKIKLKDIKVGGSAQTTAALGVDFKLLEGLSVGLNWNYYGRNYADYAFSGSDLEPGSEMSIASPWEIPDGHQFDFSAKYRFKIGKCKATIYGNVDNVFDQQLIMDAYDGGSGSWEKASRIFYAFGRTYSVRLKVNF